MKEYCRKGFRLNTLICMIMVLFFFCRTVLCETGISEDIPVSGPEQQTMEDDENIISIETKGIYGKMRTSYEKGYAPTIENGSVVIDLPLIASSGLRGDVLTASVTYSNVEDMPFEIKKYEKTVAMTVIEGQEIYLVTFELPLKADRKNGTYPVNIAISAVFEDTNQKYETEFINYVSITDGKKENSSGGQTARSQPMIIISSREISPEDILAGQSFSLKLTLTNTSKNRYVKNMVCRVSADENELRLSEDTDMFYIDRIDKNSDHELTFQFTADRNLKSGYYYISVSFTYEDSDVMTYTLSDEIPVRISADYNVEMTVDDDVKRVDYGDVYSLPISIINYTRDPIYNVRCELNVDGLKPLTSLFVGDMEGGSETSLNVQVMASYPVEAEKSGRTEGSIILKYETNDGKVITVEKEYSIVLDIPEEKGTEQEDAKEEKTLFPYFIAGGGLLAGMLLMALIVWIGRRSGK
ncbi:MAG: hypothetical protein IKN92_00675 [Clostridia bacterium]|nr:hypothetical protein [Clostridia bacterium]